MRRARGSERGATHLSLVTVSYFSGREVATCLSSARRAITGAFDATIVNNATVHDVDAALAWVPEAQVVEAGSNLGYGAAVNLAARRLGDDVEWILVTNPDVVFLPGSIDSLLALASSDDSIGAVGPRTLRADGSVYPSARDIPSLATGVGHALFSRVWRSNRWSERYLRADRAGAESVNALPTGWLSGACLLIRRSAFEQVQGFDERFFMYFEDVDLSERLAEAGWGVYLVPSARVVHSGGTTTSRQSRSMISEHHRSAYRYLAKKYHQWYLWPLRVVLSVGLTARAAVQLSRAELVRQP